MTPSAPTPGGPLVAAATAVPLRPTAAATRPPPRSRRARVRDELLTAIRAGRYPDGRLPPEAELAAGYAVSRTTIRAVLQQLADDGIVTRRRRHGTTVNAGLLRSSMRLNRLVPFTTLVAQAGHEPSTDPQRVAAGRLDADDAAALDVAAGTPCVEAARLLRATGRPVIAVRDLVPLALIDGGLDAVLDADSTFAFLARNVAAPADYACTEIVPRVATAAAPTALDLAPGTPYVELVETIHSALHQPLAVSRVAIDDRLVRLSLLRRDG